MKNSIRVALFAAAGLSADAAMAQQTMALEEIVVTASKREQTLSEIPSAVSVTSAETIEKAHITDILDLHTAVPSLRTSQLQNSTQTNFIIRGFGNGANNPGIESSVGVFIDGVYRSRSASQIGDLLDVQRIEVLRGPQSTLFGQNASVGVISVVTKKPSFTPTGSIEVGFGNYSAKQVRAGYSGPITDRVAFSLSGNYNERDGYFKNLTDGNSLNDRKRWDLRGQVLFQATENLSFRLIGDVSNIDELCCGVVNLQNGPTGALIAQTGGQVYTGDRFDRRGYLNKDPFNRVDNNGVSLQVDWKNGAWKLTSITAKRNQKAKFDYDADFTSADILATNLNDSHIDTFTQELRLAFDNAGPVSGLLGGYYFNEHVRYSDTLTWGASIRPYATGLIFAQTGSLTVLNGPRDVPRFASWHVAGQRAGSGHQHAPGQRFLNVVWAARLEDRRPPDAHRWTGLYQEQQGRVDRPDRHRRVLIARLCQDRLRRCVCRVNGRAAAHASESGGLPRAGGACRPDQCDRLLGHEPATVVQLGTRLVSLSVSVPGRAVLERPVERRQGNLHRPPGVPDYRHHQGLRRRLDGLQSDLLEPVA
jgi:outer membrane receptor protein involved in Fe transport